MTMKIIMNYKITEAIVLDNKGSKIKIRNNSQKNNKESHYFCLAFLKT